VGEQLKGVTGCNHMSFILVVWLFFGMVLNDFDVTLAHWIASFFLCSSEQNEDETSLKNGLSASANSIMSCSGTSIICFCYLTTRPVVIPAPCQHWWQFSFIFIEVGKIFTFRASQLLSQQLS